MPRKNKNVGTRKPSRAAQQAVGKKPRRKKNGGKNDTKWR